MKALEIKSRGGLDSPCDLVQYIGPLCIPQPAAVSDLIRQVPNVRVTFLTNEENFKEHPNRLGNSFLSVQLTQLNSDDR